MSKDNNQVPLTVDMIMNQSWIKCLNLTQKDRDNCIFLIDTLIKDGSNKESINEALRFSLFIDE